MEIEAKYPKAFYTVRHKIALAFLRLLGFQFSEESPPIQPISANPTSYKKHFDKKPKSDCVDKALAFIWQRGTFDLQVGDVAKAVYKSETTLRRLFHAEIEKSPHEVITRFAVEHAKLDLREPGSQIKNVVEKRGFETIHHFYRVFKKVTGMPPAAWQKGIKLSKTINWWK